MCCTAARRQDTAQRRVDIDEMGVLLMSVRPLSHFCRPIMERSSVVFPGRRWVPGRQERALGHLEGHVQDRGSGTRIGEAVAS